jgi:nucleotide-binding universal stress UspA family protein
VAADTFTDNGPILVPVDFSSCSEVALAWAANAARLDPRRIVVLHVVHDPANTPGYYRKAGGVPDGKQPLQKLENAAEAMMKRFLKRVRKRFPATADTDIETKLLIGIPASRILEVAEKIDAALIVLGSHGRTGLSRTMLGSKAEQVARLSRIPVTIVKDPA